MQLSIKLHGHLSPCLVSLWRCLAFLCLVIGEEGTRRARGGRKEGKEEGNEEGTGLSKHNIRQSWAKSREKLAMRLKTRTDRIRLSLLFLFTYFWDLLKMTS